MTPFILAEKTEQSQTFNERGERIPITFLKSTPCYLVDIKEPSKNGYFAVQLGFGQIKNIKKPVQGQLAKAGIKTPLRFLREFRLEKYQDKLTIIQEEGRKGIKIGEHKIFIGQEVNPELVFKKGDLVKVSGISKGKGFQGVVKRHHFSGGPRTRGQSLGERAPGSIGMTTTPGRVFKGKRMAGRMGQRKVTVRGLEIIEVKKGEIVVKGLVPGAKKGLIEVRLDY